ncbi:unnamed protein product, partial [Ixodes hexagonus]
PSHSFLGVYRKWAVSTDAAPCAIVARKIKGKGGTLADIAVATLLCMGVVLPHSMGIGGGFLATYYNATSKKAVTLIARECAPAAAHRDMFVVKPLLAQRGSWAISFPGMLACPGTHRLRQVASILWRRCWWDERRVAGVHAREFSEGSALSSVLKTCLCRKEANRFLLFVRFRNPFWSQKRNDTRRLGEMLTQPDLAATLTEIAENGPETFYSGNIADKLIRELRAHNGIMTSEDLRSFRVLWSEPMMATLGDGHIVHSVPPPGSGAVYAYIMAIMDGFRNDTTGRLEDSPLTLHRFVEASKFGYAKRALLGDPAFLNVTELVDRLTSSEYAAETRKKINDKRTFLPAYYSDEETETNGHGTAHFSFLDENGDAIAVSSSINTYFGSKLRVNGIVLNNQMDDFSTPGASNFYRVMPSETNFIAPGKRPMSSMVPVVITNKKGSAELVIGGTGGSKITSGVALVS